MLDFLYTILIGGIVIIIIEVGTNWVLDSWERQRREQHNEI